MHPLAICSYFFWHGIIGHCIIQTYVILIHEPHFFSFFWQHDPGQATPFLEDDDDVETTICFGTRALCSKATISRSFNALVKIANPDKETKRLLALGVPFTLASMIGSFFEAVAVALVSNYLGVNALSAYVVTNLLVGLSDVFINGISDSLNTVCSHAIGAENYKLAGQYVQIAMTVYCVLGIPVMGVWWFIMEDCLRLFGLNEEVVAIGAQYSKIVIFHYMFSGLFDSYTALLDISGYAVPATVFDVITGGAEAVVIWSLLEFQEGMTLYWVGVAHLVTGVSCFIVFTSIAVCKGWLDPFWDGMFKTFAMKVRFSDMDFFGVSHFFIQISHHIIPTLSSQNTNAVKYVLKTAIPLSIGSLLEYGEWEALTFFAAFLGPAEVAAWGILEAIWDLFESATEGLSEAGSIRLAFHLGKGNVKQAPISAWKSLFLSSILAVFITAIFFICGDDLPGWFTKDETLQNMLTSMIPLVGMGNILMIFGMVSWSLVGAQGRYKLATTVSAIMSFCVTIPLAAVFCIAYQFTLDGLVAAIVIGYSTTGLVLAYILLRSDWKHISKTIQEYHEEEGSMSSSSSSSSSSSDDSEEGNRLKKDVLGQIDDDKTFSNDELVNSSSESLEHEIQIMPIGNV